MSNFDVVEFILQEYEKEPVAPLLTHKLTEETLFKLKLVKFLAIEDRQKFLNSAYTHLYGDPDGFSIEDQAFILLYWRYKRHWKRKEKLEWASIADITQFLTKYYMEF